MLPFAILIGGATATGKTRLAFEIQEKIPSIILNADSMQVYEDLQTLTNMPDKKDIIKHSCNLFGYIQYPDKCSVGNWHKNVKSILEVKKNKIPIFVGGTGLYLDSLNGNMSNIPEINLRVIIIGVLLSVVMGSANVYLGLKAGMTVSASIPAAVVGMLVLRQIRTLNNESFAGSLATVPS